MGFNYYDPNDFSGDVNKEVGDIKEWEEKAQPMLDDYGRKVVSSSFYRFLIFFLFLGIISMTILGGIFVYQVSDGKLQSIVNTYFEPQINNTVNNEYDFQPTTNNQYDFQNQNNHTIIVNNYIDIPNN